MLQHHTLVAWQRADDLFIEIHRLTRKNLPAEERYELSSQLRRAAYSVPANIVEGFARQYRKEKFHFLSIASASLAEVGYGLHAARRLGYLAPEHYDELELKVRQVAAPLNGLLDKYRGNDSAEGVATARSPRGTKPRPPRGA